MTPADAVAGRVKRRVAGPLPLPRRTSSRPWESPTDARWGDLAGIVGYSAFAAFLAMRLLGVPIGPFDECALLLGARLIRAGWLPYSDFYTFYGPLGYSVLSLFPDPGNYGLKYRAAQAVALLALALGLAFISHRVAGKGISTWIGAACVLAGASVVLEQPHYLGWCGVTLSLGFFTLLRCTKGPRPTIWLLVGTGAGLAITALIRPGFAVYTGASLVVVEALTKRFREARALLVAAASSFIVVWLTFYARIHLGDAFHDAILIPSRMSMTSARFIYPFVAQGALELLAASAVGVALFLAATSFAFSQGRAPIILAVVGAIGSGLVAPLAVASARPGPVTTAASIALFAIASATVFLARSGLVDSPRLAVSSACGLTSIAFLHYFWNRADVSHFAPSLALAIAAAVLAAAGLPSTFSRATQAALVLAAALPILFAVGNPAALKPQIFEGSLPVRLRQELPAARFSAQALAAVRLADSEADPGSRFVALSSNHQRTELSAVVLFLLSKRLPYTHWYAYDPGIQDSEKVQNLMLSELRRSGSRTAVIWDASQFVDVRSHTGPEPGPTELDRVVREDYPIVLARYGWYEVRRRRD